MSAPPTAAKSRDPKNRRGIPVYARRAMQTRGLKDVLTQQQEEERELALRALLMRPLISSGDPNLELVRRHADYLRDWFGREAGWNLQVERQCARLYKRPATFNLCAVVAAARPGRPRPRRVHAAGAAPLRADPGPRPGRVAGAHQPDPAREAASTADLHLRQGRQRAAGAGRTAGRGAPRGEGAGADRPACPRSPTWTSWRRCRARTRTSQIRIYNPSFGKAKLNYFDYAGSVLCCFRRFNQRMHTKLMLVDDRIGITGGRNYQDDYFDWDAEYNFRDRDVLVAGPASREMAANFEAFWNARRSVPVERLNDVGRKLLKEGVPAMPPAALPAPGAGGGAVGRGQRRGRRCSDRLVAGGHAGGRGEIRRRPAAEAPPRTPRRRGARGAGTGRR